MGIPTVEEEYGNKGYFFFLKNIGCPSSRMDLLNRFEHVYIHSVRKYYEKT